MSNKIFGFCAQKVVGNKGEDDFLKYYADYDVVKLDGRKCDFLVGGMGAEVKADRWLLKDTPNVFLETISNHKNGKEGGVFRALADGATFFVYYFINDKTFFWYRTKDLCRFLRRNINKFEKKIIRNKTYTSEGRLVPRVVIERFLFRKDSF